MYVKDQSSCVHLSLQVVLQLKTLYSVIDLPTSILSPITKSII